MQIASYLGQDTDSETLVEDSEDGDTVSLKWGLRLYPTSKDQRLLTPLYFSTHSFRPRLHRRA